MKATFQTLILTGLALGPTLGVAAPVFGQLGGTWQGTGEKVFLANGNIAPISDFELTIIQTGGGVTVTFNAEGFDTGLREFSGSASNRGFSATHRVDLPNFRSEHTITATLEGDRLIGGGTQFNDGFPVVEISFSVACVSGCSLVDEREEEEDACAETTFLWEVTGGGTFHDAINWFGDKAPETDGSVIFADNTIGSGTVILNQDTIIDSLLVLNDSVVLDVNTFTLRLDEQTRCFPALEVSDPNDASLTLVGAGEVFSESVIVGNRAGESGTLRIENTTSLSTFDGECVVGSRGLGTVEVSGGGDLSCGLLVVGDRPASVGIVRATDTSSDLSLNSLVIGQDAGASGAVTLDGIGPQVVEGAVTIGDAGSGHLVFANGVISFPSVGNDGEQITRIAVESTSTSSATVEGAGTSWQTKQLEVGVKGTGDLFIKDGGKVESTVALVGVLQGGVGRVTITGSSLWDVTGGVFVGTLGDGVIAVDPTSNVDTPQFFLGPKGRLEVVAVNISGASNGAAPKIGSSFRTIADTPGLHTQKLTIQAGGELVAETVTLDLGGQLAGDGEFNFDLSNPGTLAPGADECTPGALVIDGDYIQDSQGQLEIKLGGKDQGTDHDALIVNGKATLAGALNVSAINNFRPKPGDEFEILTADTVEGQFERIEGSGKYDATYEPDRVVLVVIAAPTKVAATCTAVDSDAGAPSDGATGQDSQGTGGLCGVGMVQMTPLMICGFCLFGRASSRRIRAATTEYASAVRRDTRPTARNL